MQDKLFPYATSNIVGRSLAVVILLFIALLPSKATSTYYYNASASVTPSGSGTVYISNVATTNPSFGTSSTTGTVGTVNNSVILYLYAQPADEYLFSKWQYHTTTNGNWSDITTIANDNYVITGITSENDKKPNYYYFRAVFAKQEGAVKVAVAEEGRGSVSISPQNNSVNQTVTLTANPDASNGIHFLGWNKSKTDVSNFVSTDNPYTFTITTANSGTYYAHFSEAPQSIYCRIRNRATGRFLTLYGNTEATAHQRTVNNNTYDDGFKFENSLHLVSADEAKGNPMTVFLRNGSPAGTGVTTEANLVANDIEYLDLVDGNATTNKYMLTMEHTSDGVRIHTSYTSNNYTFPIYLTDEGTDYAVMQSDDTKNIYWDVYLLEDDNTVGSFGANAKAAFTGNGTYGENGKYYTTMYTYFPYKLADGVKAYYLPLAETSYNEEKKEVHFTEITDVVPMNTAVVLECPAVYDGTNNRLIPLMESQSPTPVQNLNLLNGYISISKNGAEPNKVTNNKSSMFILSKVDGDLGWYYYTANYMTPNKAYLDLSPWDEYYHQHENEARQLKFVFGKGDDETTGVIATKYAEKVDGPLFDLNGRRVTDGDAYGLKKGIYISDGKKILVK